MKLSYRPHCKEQPEGHLLIEDAPRNTACTIQLTPAGSADQEWLDNHAKLIVQAVNAFEPLKAALERVASDSRFWTLGCQGEVHTALSLARS